MATTILKLPNTNLQLAIRGVLRMSGMLCFLLLVNWIHWPQLFYWMGTLFVVMSINLLIIAKKSPGLLKDRLKRDEPTEGFDKVIMWSMIPLALVVFAVAAIEVAVLQAPISWGWMGLGLALTVLSDIPILWSMLENPYLERTVRIQEEKAHQVITTGPYRIVRHPMYVGVFLMMLGWPLGLGSWWAFIPVGVLLGFLLVRTELEDRMLRKELNGYEAYTQQTRWKLLPGLY